MINDTEEIKKRINIVDLISGYLSLKKAGSNFKAVCPFHTEKTPSLMVSEEKQIWHCFGCNEGGDIFTFVMKMENLEFPEALKLLADRAGVKLKQYKAEEKSHGVYKNRLYELNNLTRKFFQKVLLSHPAGSPALQYLKKRRLSLTTIKEFGLGYAFSSRSLNAFLKKRGFSDLEIQAAGSPDRFFRRIMFPITDALGNTIAFTGRLLEEKSNGPKYLNTSETPIFHKSRTLYNLDKARLDIKAQKAAVVVEGQMDVIASFQAGVKNVVATSGTALTADHLTILGRYSPNVIFAFDSDTAGLESAKKAYEMAIAAGLNVKMAELGRYKDPGEMAAMAPAEWQAAVLKAKAVIDWYFDLSFNKQLTTDNEQLTTELSPQRKKEIAKEILPVLKKIPDTIEQAHYVGLLAKRLDVSEKVIFDALAKITAPKQEKTAPRAKPTNLTVSELVLALLIKNPEKLKTVEPKLREEDFARAKERAIYKAMILAYNKVKPAETAPPDFLEKVRAALPYEERVKVDDLILMISEETAEEREIDLEEALQKIKKERRELLKNYYAAEIKKAEEKQDHQRLKRLIGEFQEAIKEGK